LVGDKELIETEDGFAVLIDGSPNEMLAYQGKLIAHKKK
jgi:hypothetical protein